MIHLKPKHPSFRDFKPINISIKEHASFLSKNPLLESLRPQMIDVAKAIVLAVMSQRRIFIKHHADTDGFCAGLALERAIVPLVDASNEKKQAVWEKYKRMASQSPYYHIEDVTKDISQFLTLKEKFNEKAPLVILTDLGSGPENILPIKQLQLFGCDVIVIDHHPVDPIVDSLLKYHINPTKIDPTASLSAGILCSELSRILYPLTTGEDLLCAISAVADRIDVAVAQPYFDLVAPQNYDQQTLLRIAKALDFTVYNLRNMESRELIGILLGDDRVKQRQLVDLVMEELSKREEKVFEQAKNLIQVKQAPSLYYATVDMDQFMLRDGYPRLGNISGMLFDRYQSTFDKPFIFIGVLPNQMTFRAGDHKTFDYPTVQKLVAQKVPTSFVEGGGHPGAGTFRFAQNTYPQVWAVVEEYLRLL
jgi:archaea-specific RecJ-like exonuclease